MTLLSFMIDLKEPFKLQNGWLLWAVIGLVGALIAISLVGVVLNSLNGGSPQREVVNILHCNINISAVLLFVKPGDCRLFM